MRDRIPIILTVLAAVGLTLAASATSTAQAGSIAQPGSAARPSGTASWQPEPASYGVGKPVDIPVRGDTVMRTPRGIASPPEPATGARAAGTFPVLLTQNPYGAARSDPTAPG